VWNPADLLTDLDLLALDRACLTDFGVTTLADKRRVAADWVAQRVEQAGYTLHQHAIRKAPAAVFGFDGAAYTDVTAAALDTTDADLPLSSLCAVPSSAAVYVGYHAPFRGCYVGVVDAVNANTATLGAAVWTGTWTAVTSLQDGTRATASKSLSGGGLVAWQQPDQWSRRSVNNSLLYWAKLTVSSSLTAGTAASQLTPVVPSRLSLPAAQYALGLLYQESYGSNRGQWAEKAEKLFKAAEDSLAVAIPLIADEFDVDEDQAVSGAEASSVTAAGNYAIWERG
jgi:hypothetical protein